MAHSRQSWPALLSQCWTRGGRGRQAGVSGPGEHRIRDPTCQLELRQGVPLGLAAQHSPSSGPGKEDWGCAISPAVRSSYIICKAIDPLGTFGREKTNKTQNAYLQKAYSIFGYRISLSFCCVQERFSHKKLQKGEKMTEWIQVLKKESAKGHLPLRWKRKVQTQQNLWLPVCCLRTRARFCVYGI